MDRYTAPAAFLHVTPRTMAAVVVVESSGAGLTSAGPVIRLEVHKLWGFVPTDKRDDVDAHFHVGGPKPWQGHGWRPFATGPWRPMHTSQHDEHEALALAKGIDRDAAIRATSYGLGQVLGDNWRDCGFASPSEFESTQATEDGQLDTMARFIASKHAALSALQRHDWRAFALAYNGPGQPDWYADKLAKAYARAG